MGFTMWLQEWFKGGKYRRAITIGLSLGFLLVYQGFMWICATSPGTQDALRKLQQTPFSPVDFVLGFVAALCLCIAIIFWEARRFSREFERDGGPGGSGGGKVRLPFRGKVISVEDWQKTEIDGMTVN